MTNETIKQMNAEQYAKARQTTVAQDVAALRAVVDGQHAQTETPAEVLAEMREWGNGEGCFNDNPEGDPEPTVFYPKKGWDQLCDRLERSLAAGKVAPTAWMLRDSRSKEIWLDEVCVWTNLAEAQDCADDMNANVETASFEVFALYTAPPADPAKASEPDLHAHLLDMLGVKTHEEAGAEIGRLHGIAYGKASVRIDFPGIGHAGPFAVVNGEVTLPEATMTDLAHHFRMGYVAKASGSDTESDPVDGDAFTRAFERGRKYEREQASGSAPDGWMDAAVRILCEVTGDTAGRITDDVRMDHLCDVARRISALATPPASAPEVTGWTDAMHVAAARAIWLIRREEEDRCDQELEDLPPDHSVWDEARAALTAALQQEGKSHGQ